MQRQRAVRATIEAESMIGLYKLECIRRDGPFRGVDDLELATLSWVDWFNNHRLHSACADLTPTEYEHLHYGHRLREALGNARLGGSSSAVGSR